MGLCSDFLYVAFKVAKCHGYESEGNGYGL